MIQEALNKSTGKTTPIGEASKDEEYECLFCHADMYPAQGQDLEWHYRCKRGHHKRTFCAQMAQCSHNNRIIHDVEGIIPENFFDGLYRPEKEDGDGGGQHPVVPPVGGVDPGEYEVVPCRTLSQLWKAKVAEMPHDMKIGKGILSDVFIKQKDFWRYLNKGDALNNRILELQPIKYYQNAKVVVFVAQWRKKLKNGYEDREKLFLLRFSDDELFNDIQKRLFEWVIKDDGSSSPVRTFDAVLVAGWWRVCNADEYYSYGVHPYEKCIGVQLANCTSRKQIYMIPEMRRNNKKAK